MADILTDTSAAYAATTVLATKINNTPRVDADAVQIVIAQWGNEIDSALKAVSEWLQGDSPAGASTKTVQLLGNLAVAENLATQGGTLEVGSVALASSKITLKGSNTSVQSLYFGDPGSSTSGGVSLDHSTDTMDLRAASASRVQLNSSVLRPTNHGVTDLGDPTHRWREAHVTSLYASGGGTVGTGGDVTLTINGSSTPSLEPKITFEFGGTPACQIKAEIDPEGSNIAFMADGKVDASGTNAILVSRRTTAERTALADDFGLLVFDTDLNQLFHNDGSGWIATFVTMPSLAGSAGDVRLSTTQPATFGETGNATPTLYFANGQIQTGHWWLQIPKSYITSSSLTLRLWWTGTNASAVTDVQWRFATARFVNGDLVSIGSANATTTTPAASPGPAVFEQMKFTDFTMSNVELDGVQAGELMRLSITRVGNAVADTYTGSASLLGWQLFL